MREVRSKDFSIAVTCLLIKVCGIWFADTRAEQRQRNLALFNVIMLHIIATGIAFRDIYFSWGNFGDCVYISCNILYLAISSFKIATIYVHKVEFFDLVLFTFKNFWHSRYDPAEQLIINDCKKSCGIFIMIVCICAQGTCAGYLIPPILANIGKNYSERVLPFNMWLDFPIEKSPIFEMLFTIQVMSVLFVSMYYICFDNFLCLANLHVVSQFRILQYRLASLRDHYNNEVNKVGESQSDHADICYTRLRSCVQHHQMLTEYCRKLEKVFSSLILGQVVFLSLVICLLSCQMFLFQAPFPKRVGLMLDLSGTLCQAFIFTYSCDGLNRHNAHVGASVFSGPWSSLPMDKIGRRLRRNVIIIIMRSNYSCSLTAGGFFPVSLETYTAILSTAMSYFTLLRQSSLNAGT